MSVPLPTAPAPPTAPAGAVAGSAHDHGAHIKSIELERLVFFSDAVVAIAITLLVLELKLPDTLTPPYEHSFRRALLGLAPMLLSYAFSFFLVGMYWFAHHRIFRYVRRWDGGLVAHNFHFLAWVALLPFAVTLMGRFGGLRTAVVGYGAIQFMLGIAQWMLWRHASRDHRLIDPALDPKFVRFISARSLVLPAVALLSIAIGLVAPAVWMAWWAYIVSWPAQRLLSRAFGRRGERPTAA